MRPTFLDAYIECALWSSNDESTPQGGEPFDANYSAEDIAPETLQRMREDCEAFQRDNAELLAQVPQRRAEWTADEQNGHDFWLTRNGHGAGFWDRGYGALGRQLTDACRPWGSFDLYLGDDGLIHGG
jgi:hypothetical protein